MRGNYRHGMRYTRIYNIWRSMRQRCFNPRCDAYKHYGGRGITVCTEWENFQTFYDWAMSNGYAEDLTIDRVDTDKNYEPSNCRWVTQKVQQNNRTNNRLLEVDGVSHTIAEWGDATGIQASTIWARLKTGWSPKRAVTEPAFVGHNQFN